MASAMLPKEHDILKSFVLPDMQGQRIDLESFRQQRNLVVVVVNHGTPEADALVDHLAASRGALAAEEAIVVVVVRGGIPELPSRWGASAVVLADEAGAVVDALCDGDCSMYVTDRFREIFTMRLSSPLLPVQEILKWLGHINRQCPE